MNLLNKFFIVAISGLVFACSNYNVGEVKELSDYSKEFAQENANVFLKSFSDHRQGTAKLLPTGSKTMYAYKPQSLTNGQMLPLLGFYLYNALDKQDLNAEMSIGIDVSLRDVKTLIKHGAFSRDGYYWVELQARIILTDIKSEKLIGTIPLVLTDSKIRTTTTGRTPSAAEDKKELISLLDRTSLKLADTVLAKSEPLITEYLNIQAEISSVIQEKIEAKKDVEIPVLQEKDLNLPPEVLKQIEEEEKDLIQNKERQQRLYEKKLLEQKYIDVE